MEEDIPDGNIFVNTVQENMTRYRKRDVKKATEAYESGLMFLQAQEALF